LNSLKHCDVGFIVGNQNLHMTHLTRDVLIKTIVAEEMVGCGGTDYVQNLKSAYHRWEHESSETLCKKYNKIKNAQITVEILAP
jgi:hypothetical protein